jgi:asparagine synthase (glutamine-hydrolysing)
MQAQSTRPVKTFTIGFHEDGYDEAAHAREVARHLGTEHTELYVTPEEAMAVIPELPALYDEPFADSSQIPTTLVSRLARESVTVSLSGDGGDELFGGYARYFQADRLWYRIGRFPRAVRATVSGTLGAISPGGWDRILGLVRPVLPRRLGRYACGERVYKLAELLVDAGHEEAVYQCLSSKWGRAARLVRGATEPHPVITDRRTRADLGDSVGRMMYIDLIRYLPDDILTKVDRASMGIGLESRAPFLDHRVVEFAWRVPMALKFRQGQGKWLLRQVLRRYVPPALIERPKMGFCVPIGAWLRGPLKEWAGALLDGGRLHDEGFFDPRPIRRKWLEHLSGIHDWQHHLWDVLMFQAWFESQRPAPEIERVGVMGGVG